MAPHLATASPGGGRRDVEVDLSRCSALELRQLQSFLGACHDAPPRRAEAGADGGAGGEQQQQGGGGGGGGREVAGFPAGMLRDTSLSEHAGVVWPRLIVGAGLKARNVTLLPGGEPLPPGAAPLKGKGAPLGGDAAPAGAGGGGGGVPFKAAARRFSDTGTSALRPPLPPARSRLGQPPTPTHAAGAAAGAAAAGHATPFAAAGAAGDAAAAGGAAGGGDGAGLHGTGSLGGSNPALPGAHHHQQHGLGPGGLGHALSGAASGVAQLGAPAGGGAPPRPPGIESVDEADAAP